jgi:hypothetical protein
VGLSDVTARWAARQAHALAVETPGRWRTRAAVERAVLTRGWRHASSPADADVLVVCGEPGPRLQEAVDLVWQQMPGPRVRVDVREYDDLAARLEEAHAGLLDTARHRHDARHRPTAPDLLADETADQADHVGADHEGMAHEGMDHGDMEMAPGGIPLAVGGQDRDDLEMDVLDVRLGPVLAHWPAGLVLCCSLQGDVITEARGELVDGDGPQEGGPTGPARCLDNLVSLLALTGWDDAAAEARRLRDTALETDGGAEGPPLEALRRKVRRSRMLRWSLRGIRPLSVDDAHRHGLPTDVVGDTYDRLLLMLDRAAGHEDVDRGTQHADPVFSADHVADLVTGLDLATARLVVASLDVHGLTVGHADRHEEMHG